MRGVRINFISLTNGLSVYQPLLLIERAAGLLRATFVPDHASTAVGGITVDLVVARGGVPQAGIIAQFTSAASFPFAAGVPVEFALPSTGGAQVTTQAQDVLLLHLTTPGSGVSGLMSAGHLRLDLAARH